MAKNVKAMLVKKIAENTARHASAVQEVDLDLGKRYEKIPVDLIEPNPHQPRRIFPADELQSLAQSISATGLAQPISVRQVDGRFQLIAGERRWRAHQILKAKSIEALVCPITDEEMAILALAENLEREDLCDYEVGRALRPIVSKAKNLTKLAESLGMDRKDMYRYLAFCELPACVIDRLEINPRTMGRAAAEKLKACVQKLSDRDGFESVLMKGWTEVEEGRLDQIKLPTFIEVALRNGGQSAPAETTETELRRGGKKVGGVKRSARNLVVTLKTAAFSEPQQAKLLAFIEQLVEEGADA